MPMSPSTKEAIALKQKTKLNKAQHPFSKEFFSLENFVGGIGIMLVKVKLLRSPDIL